MIRILFFLGVTLLSSPCFSLNGIKILEVSSSGKSILINIGRYEKIAEGDKATLVFQLEPNATSISRPALTITAKAEAIKVNARESYWFLKEVENPALIKKYQNMLLLTVDGSNFGRRDLRFKHKKVVLRKGQTQKEYLDAELDQSADEVVEKDEEYEDGEKLTSSESDFAEDVETLAFENMDEAESVSSNDYEDDLEVLFNNELDTPVENDAYREEMKEKIHDSVVEGNVEKYNSLPFGTIDLYKETSPFRSNMGKIQGKYVSKTVFDKYKKSRERETYITNQALAKMKQGGPLWSADMDDEQLRRYFVSSGIQKEYRRREKALENRSNNEIFIKGDIGLSNHTTSEDANNQGNGYSLTFGYDYHLMRWSESLRKFSLELSIRNSKNYYNLSPSFFFEINGEANETIYRMVMNWYINRVPSEIKRPIFFVGAGFGVGYSIINSAELSKDYNFQIVNVPILQAGVKYRFSAGDEVDSVTRIGYGIMFNFAYEAIRASTGDEVTDDIDGLISVNDLKFSVGLNVYF